MNNMIWDAVLWLRKKLSKDKEDIIEAVNNIQNLFETSADATASSSDILAGKTAYNGTALLTGSMKDRRGITVTAGATTQDDEYTYLTVPEEACFNASSKLRTKNSNLIANKRIAVKALTATIPTGFGTATAQATFTIPKTCPLLEIEYGATGGYYYSCELFIDDVSQGAGGSQSRTVSKTNVPAGTVIKLVAKRDNPDNLESNVSAYASIAYIHNV